MTRTFTERIWCFLSNSGLCKTEIGTNGWTGGGEVDLCVSCEERRAGRPIEDVVRELVTAARKERRGEEP
jgi:hypothetical protein